MNQSPPRDVVIYDGRCRFCCEQTERLRRWDGGGRLEFLSLHDPAVASRFPELTQAQLMAEMYVVDRDGRGYAGAEAVRYLSRRLPRLWALAPFLHIPGTRTLWRWLYRQIALRRYRLRPEECASGTCRVHFDREQRT